MNTRSLIPLALAGLATCSQALAQPTFSTHPADQSVSLNATAQFKAAARTSGGTLTYAWWFKDAALDPALNPSATKNTLLLSNVTEAMAGPYWVAVKDDNGSANSRVATLTVDPTFTQITAGTPVTDLGSSGYGGWADYDGDGYPDLTAVGYRFRTTAVYHNNRDGTFGIESSHPDLEQDDGFGPWGDWDNDGRTDWMVSRASHGVLLCFPELQDGFTEVSFGLNTAWWWNCAVADYDRDGLLDFYFTYVDNNRDRLYRNLGGASFALQTADDVGPLANAASSMARACWGDFDDDGWPDLYVPRFRVNRSLLFRNEGTGRFVSRTNLVTTTPGQALAGAWGDYDNDGRLDLCVACLWGGTTTVYRNLGNGEFESPAGVPRLAGNENFAAWADYDNDGFLDLYLSHNSGTPFTSGSRLFHNKGDGSFETVTTGSIVNDRPLNGAGTYTACWFDYDNDGFLDLYVLTGDDHVSIETANLLYHNNGNHNTWLQLRLIGTVSNRGGIGAKVRLKATYAGQTRWQRRDITAGDLYNGNNLYAHFGLGDATQAEIVRIEWPSGIVQELSNVPANRILTVTEPPRLQALGPGRIRIQCWKGQKAEGYVSDDLSAWTSLGIFTDETGTLEVTDPGAGTKPYRFYRAVSR